MTKQENTKSTNVCYLAYVGADGPIDNNYKNDLLCQIIEKVSERKVKIVKNKSEADLILAYPYMAGKISFNLKWIAATIAKKIFGLKDCTWIFRWLIGVGRQPLLFISHENLDRPFWWKMFGTFLVSSDVPRLTFWPKQIDPRGCRFPYWYNYVEWTQYPRDQCYSRFGRYYKVTELMSPLVLDSTRLNSVVVVSSHMDHPRSSLIKHIGDNFKVEIYGSSGIKFNSSKIELMRKYMFAFCAENSVGYGYDTEKIPEAWVAGCIPLAINLNPFSDFNPDILNINPSEPNTFTKTLLLKSEPSLKEIEEYVKKEFF